jgi:hypothetical protein
MAHNSFRTPPTGGLLQYLITLSVAERRAVLDSQPEFKDLPEDDKLLIMETAVSMREDIDRGLDKKGELVRRQHCQVGVILLVLYYPLYCSDYFISPQVCHIELLKVLLCGGW